MTPKAASKAVVFGGLPTDMQPLPVLAELVGLHHNTALSGLSWSWTSRSGDPHTINSSVRSLDNPLPKLKFKLTKTSNVAVDGGIDGLYDRLAELQSGPIGAKPTAMTFRGLLMSKFHTLKPPSSAAFPRFYGLLLSRVYGNENIF
jgi:hypothetical protein